VPDPDYYRRFVEGRARLEAAQAEADEVLSEAEAVYAPAEPMVVPSEVKGSGPGLGRFTRLLAWVGGPDRCVTRPIWFLWAAASHLVRAGLLLVLTLFAAAIFAVVLRLVLPMWAAYALALPAAGAATAGTVVPLWRSFRDQLDRFPW